MGAHHDHGGDRPSRPNGAATVPGAGRGGHGVVETKTINLALQGGGAHGAFAWGVLDKLLEDGRLRIEGISATSAGAMNATVLAYGWAEGGPEGARAALDGMAAQMGASGIDVGALEEAPTEELPADGAEA